jgi:hypothetical protein
MLHHPSGQGLNVYPRFAEGVPLEGHGDSNRKGRRDEPDEDYPPKHPLCHDGFLQAPTGDIELKMATMFSDAPKRRVLVSEANRTIPDPAIRPPKRRVLVSEANRTIPDPAIRPPKRRVLVSEANRTIPDPAIRLQNVGCW